jgi:hypothetical protein
MAPNRKPLPHENVVSAGVVGVAAPKVSGGGLRGKVMEERMAKAIIDALSEGVSINSPEIKARIMAARRG